MIKRPIPPYAGEISCAVQGCGNRFRATEGLVATFHNGTWHVCVDCVVKYYPAEFAAFVAKELIHGGL